MDISGIGAADDPDDDSRMFEAITAELDIDAAAIARDVAAEQATETPPAVSEPTSDRSTAPAAPPEPEPAPAPQSTRQPATAPIPPVAAVGGPMIGPPPRLPRLPSAPDYWGRHGLVAVYWIAILTGAIGQVIFFGELFDLGMWGYVAAAIIATTAETVMVSSGDTALHLRAEGRRKAQWLPFLLIAFLAAIAASGMNLSHWWAKNPSMAIIFGGIAFLGFVLHVVHGTGAGTQYLAEKRRYDAVVAEFEAEQRAAAEQARRERERQRRQVEQAARKPIAPTRRVVPGPAKKPASKQVDLTTLIPQALEAERKAGGRDKFGYRTLRREFGLTDPQARRLRQLMDEHSR